MEGIEIRRLLEWKVDHWLYYYLNASIIHPTATSAKVYQPMWGHVHTSQGMDGYPPVRHRLQPDPFIEESIPAFQSEGELADED